MIYSRFGSKLTLVNKHQDGNGRLSIYASSNGTSDVREYNVGDLKADQGLAEIDTAVAKLPWRVVMKKAPRSR